MAYATKAARAAYAKRWRADPKNAEKARAASKRYSARNRELERERCRRWAAANPERNRDPVAARETARLWALANPDRRSANAAKRRALKAGAKVETVSPAAVFERDGHTCQICGDPTSGTWPSPHSPSLDHIVPLSKGGEHSYANTQCAHLLCNVRKGARTPATVIAEAA